jgi:hypothetical protein
MYAVDFLDIGWLVLKEICKYPVSMFASMATRGAFVVSSHIPSSGPICSPGRMFSSSEYSGSEIASGFVITGRLSTRSLPSHPLLSLGDLECWSSPRGA